MSERFTLDDAERQNPLWSRMKVHLLERQEVLVRRLCRADLPENDVAMTRGELKFLKHMLGSDPAERIRPDVSDTPSERR